MACFVLLISFSAGIVNANYGSKVEERRSVEPCNLEVLILALSEEYLLVEPVLFLYDGSQRSVFRQQFPS